MIGKAAGTSRTATSALTVLRAAKPAQKSTRVSPGPELGILPLASRMDSNPQVSLETARRGGHTRPFRHGSLAFARRDARAPGSAVSQVPPLPPALQLETHASSCSVGELGPSLPRRHPVSDSAANGYTSRPLRGDPQLPGPLLRLFAAAHVRPHGPSLGASSSRRRDFRPIHPSPTPVALLTMPLPRPLWQSGPPAILRIPIVQETLGGHAIPTSPVR